ncbi:uncharacterized protein [Amphiura filiformis]|uniref:uncharacterized protein n=1 Tax=Amphiura filiformis TaxID=82378 RepID=UPI003B222BCD
MATNNVEFFARMQRLQKQQHESEQQRMELEHKFNTYLSSDKRLSRLKAAKLQRLWQKVCEDEKRSKARNQQLLSDYHRVEAHVAALSTRTERLRLLKEQYERQVELMYPRWKEQLESRRLQQQMTQQQKQQAGAIQGHPFSSGITYKSQHPASLYPSTPNGQVSAIGQSPQLLHGTQHGQSYPVGQSLQMPLGSQLPGGQAYPSIVNSSVPNGTPAQYDGGYMQGPTSHMSFGHSQSVQNSQQTDVYQGQMLPVEEQRLNPSIGNSVSHNPSLSSPYDTLTRNNAAKVPTPVFDESRGNYTQLVQDPKARLEPGSMKPPIVQNEDYSHLTQMPKHGSTGSANQVMHQEQQKQLPQQVNQVQQNVRPNQYNRPKADSIGETSSSISVSSDSQYSGSDVIRPQITISNSQQNIKPDDQKKKAEVATHQNTNDDDVGQEQGGHEEDYLAPIARDSRKNLVTPNSGRLPVTSRTDRTEPFSSEGEQEEGDEEEEETNEEAEEEDEDSAALREAMQEQLNVGSNPVVRIEVTKHASPEKQESPPKQSEQVENVREETQEEKTETEHEEDESGEESDSEISSNMSLPLSDTQNNQPVQASGDTWTAGQDTTSSRNSTEDITSSPSLSEKGFWLLIHTVEMEIDQSDNISGIYNSPNCTEAIRNEIIRSANQNSGLTRLDPNAVSMVIIQMLPSMVASFPGGCLMSDKMLNSNRPINEISVRSFMYSAALGFWDQLLRHLERLVKKGVFEPDEVADKFAPLLINPGSNMADKAVDVLHKILEMVQGEEDSFFDDSLSMTLPTPTPQRKPDTKNEANQQHLKVPPLNLGDTDRSDRSEDIDTERSDDSFFDNKVPLTETDAYQRLLGNTVDKPKGEAKEDIEDDDESDSSEDEIEKAARITPQTPTSGNRKKRNVLSSLGGSLGISYGSDDDDDDDSKLNVTGGGSTQRSDQISSASQSDLGSSPSPPGTGYVPSAMEHSMKSTARSDPLQRSAAFWGAESDMDDESEMSVPMGTGTATVKSEDDKDDFDFYD